MLRLPPFQVHLPDTALEAVQLRATLPNARYLAGGTDLLPNLKHGLQPADHLIGLAHLTELSGVCKHQDGSVSIGAATSLHILATHPLLTERLPGLAQAAAQIAGPQHRRMGTLGGNIMLDTRCLYYNQSAFWRESLGHCLKAEGDWCHVIGSKATCVAANSADTVPMLMALDAVLCFADQGGPHELPLAKLYAQNGMANHTVPSGALVTGVRIPPQPPGHRSVYHKVRARAAVDFAQLGLAVVGRFDGSTCTDLRAVAGAVMPKPKVLTGLTLAKGTTLPEPVVSELAELAFKQLRPQTSLHGDPAWRRHLARVAFTRALRQLRDQQPG